jgi:hypothetical protein
MSILVDARRATELTLLDQIDKFIGWLGRRDRTRLAKVVTVLRNCFGDEVKLEARMHEALTDLQMYVAKIRSGPIRKLLKTPVAALCRSRDVPVTWEVNPRPRRGK